MGIRSSYHVVNWKRGESTLSAREAGALVTWFEDGPSAKTDPPYFFLSSGLQEKRDLTYMRNTEGPAQTSASGCVKAAACACCSARMHIRTIRFSPGVNILSLSNPLQPSGVTNPLCNF